MIKRIKRVVFRTRFYYAMGISLISLPITFLGFSRNLYALGEKIFIFRFIFPSFRHFLYIGGFGIVPFSMCLGYLWVKSPFYKEGIKAPAENNPFAFQLGPGRDSIMYFGQIIGTKNFLRLFKKWGSLTKDEEVKYLKYIRLMEHLNQGGTLKNFPQEVILDEE